MWIGFTIPSNKTEAIALFRKNLPSMSAEGVEATYRLLLDPKTGFQRSGAINLEGVSQVLALRSKWSEQKKEFGPPTKYYDSTYYDAAMRH